MSDKIAFFRYFLDLNEVNLKFKEPPWKQHIYCQGQFHQLQIGKKIFHLSLSRVLFELSGFEDGTTVKNQKIKFLKIQNF